MVNVLPDPRPITHFPLIDSSLQFLMWGGRLPFSAFWMVNKHGEIINMSRPEDFLKQRGFTLIEVLVAAAIFSLGLGGLSLMMLTSVHGTIEARNQTTAAMQAGSLAELILLNPASLGHYINPASEAGGDCLAAEGCSSAEWAAGNLARWQFELEQNLARASGMVCLASTPDDGHAAEPACDNSGSTVVKVFWLEPHHINDDDGGLRRAVLPVAD